MPTYRTRSRTERLRKRRKTKRNLLFFSGLAVLFFVVLFSLINFGNNKPTDETGSKNENRQNEQPIQKNDKAEDSSGSGVEDTLRTDDETDMNEESNLLRDIKVTEVDSIDENVIVAYTGNWPPIGTEQSEPHTTNYGDGSLDRIEIKRAVSLVTDIPEADMIEHWIGNDGEHKVIATVSNRKTEQYYRIYLTWVNGQGWQPTKVERLREYKETS